MLNTNHPLVSVLIPLFNHAPYIERCLDSILEDGYAPIEIIVLDDGSSDDSFERCQAWQARNQARVASVRLLRQPNQGISRTRNRLAELASGEYLVFLASDDHLLPGGIAARVNVLEQHPDLMVVFGDCLIIDEFGRCLAQSAIAEWFNGSRLALRHERFRVGELILNWSVPGSSDLVRKTAFDPTVGIGGYDEALFIEDRDFYLRLLARSAVTYLDQPVAAYRVHPGNASRLDTFRREAARARARTDAQNLSLFTGIHRLMLQLCALKAANYAGWCQDRELWRLAPALLFRALLWAVRSGYRLRVQLDRAAPLVKTSRPGWNGVE
jgi:glycosyltransferase involved in cell wall biosynthesis